jgi:hypothetical protein
MAKPYGISFGIAADGLPRCSVTKGDAATDAVWEAVRQAIDARMSPEAFRNEAAQAWQELLKEDGDDAAKELRRSQ